MDVDFEALLVNLNAFLVLLKNSDLWSSNRYWLRIVKLINNQMAQNNVKNVLHVIIILLCKYKIVNAQETEMCVIQSCWLSWMYQGNQKKKEMC